MKTIKRILIATTLITGSLATVTLSSCATGTATSQVKAKPYPLDTCIVTDSRLGSMGDPITKVYNGQEIKFCCAPCIKKFEANPQKFLAKLAPGATKPKANNHAGHNH